MKKIISLLLVGLFLIGGTGTVLADETGESDVNNQRFETLVEFEAEFHQINALRITRLDLKQQVIEKNDEILSLYIEVKEAGNDETLKEAKEVRKEIKNINEQIEALQKQIETEKKAFREDVKNNNFTEARTHINNHINLLTSINGLIEEKVELLDEIIDILSK